jgi:hypothetical protein
MTVNQGLERKKKEEAVAFKNCLERLRTTMAVHNYSESSVFQHKGSSP